MGPEGGGEELDRRLMAAAVRLSRRHLGRTATNPSVATLIVRHGAAGPVILGSGITALGGRPHAETGALAEAGERAIGATAYVTLEPCAHHGRTPPCAQALIAAGVGRVVAGASDPDPRVAGKGYAMLRQAGIAVVEGVLAAEAADEMAGYLTRSLKKRPEVTLKLAVSANGMLGRAGQGAVPVTGAVARAQVHLMRARSDAILVGIGTAVSDDPQLTVRLPGLDGWSPVRIVLDPKARLALSSRLVVTAAQVPVWAAVAGEADPARRAALAAAGVRLLATEDINGRIALPELLEDLAGQGLSTLLVEGGADTARGFLEEDLVDRIVLFEGPGTIAAPAIAAPLDRAHIPAGFRPRRTLHFGDDAMREWTRV